MPSLRKLVDERLKARGVLAFVGPLTAWIGDVPYQTLTSYGWKPEGRSVYDVFGLPEGKRFTTKADAIDAFMGQLDWVTRNVSQVAWRRLPAVEKSEGGDFYVTARLALLGRTREAKAA